MVQTFPSEKPSSNVEGSAAGNLANKASRGGSSGVAILGGIASLFNKRGKGGGGDGGGRNANFGYRPTNERSAEDWYNEEHSKRMEYEREHAMRENDVGRNLKNAQGVHDIAAGFAGQFGGASGTPGITPKSVSSKMRAGQKGDAEYGVSTQWESFSPQPGGTVGPVPPGLTDGPQPNPPTTGPGTPPQTTKPKRQRATDWRTLDKQVQAENITAEEAMNLSPSYAKRYAQDVETVQGRQVPSARYGTRFAGSAAGESAPIWDTVDKAGNRTPDVEAGGRSKSEERGTTKKKTVRKAAVKEEAPPEEAPAKQEKRKPGRPKGSKNQPKTTK
jgi:hypothetical protein